MTAVIETQLRRGLALLIASAATLWAERPPVFPKPDPAAVFVEMKPPAAEGADWREPVDDWAGARQRVQTDPAWATWLADMQAKVDEWMDRRRDRVEWVAGWGHEFVSPRDGSYLTWTPEVPGEERATLSSPTDPMVEVTPTVFRAWVTKFRGRNMVTMKDAALLGRLTGDPRYAAWVAGQLDFYAEHWEQWPLQDRFYGPSRLFGQPLMDAAYLHPLLEATRLVWDDVEPARRERWRDRLFLPEARLLGESMRQIHNIACYLRAASANVALLFDDDALWHDAIEGEWGLRRQLADGVTSDYFWFEQSIGYHEFAIAGLLPLLEAAVKAGRGPALERELAIVLNMVLAPNLLRFADDTLPNPADNAALRLRRAPLRQVLQRAYRVLPTPLGWAEARRVRTWATLLDPPPPPAGPAAVMPAVGSRHFESTRFAQMKAQGWQVFFHYGQLTGSHAQEELLNFEAYFGDTAITHDPHTVGYGSPLHREYFTQGLCHNVPLVGGRGSTLPTVEVDSDPRDLPQRGELLEFDPATAVMAARQPAYQDGVSAQRSLRIENGALHDTVKVIATGDEPRRLGLALHLQARIEMPDTMWPAPDFATDRPVAFGYWEDVRTRSFKDHARFLAVSNDGLNMEVRFDVPSDFTVSVGSVPDAPVPARRMAFYLETNGTEATFRTTLTPLP